MQTKLLKARGLYSHPNLLSEVPEGALVKADNIIVDRDSVIEPRRGFGQYGNLMPDGGDRAQQLLTYKNRILRHFDSTLQYDSDNAGTFLSFSGLYSEVESGVRIKYIEANSNLYFTTSDGVKKISARSASDFTTAAGFIRDAGAPNALDVSGTINYSQAGFFLPESKVAYKIVWGYNDANKNLIIGAPSSRVVLTNFSTTDTGVVNLEFTIPNDITTADTDFFYQVYRTAVFEAGILTLDDIDPGEEFNLVIEDFPTPSQLSSRTVTLTDITPEDFRDGGAPLHTNPASGDGILQSNDQPPVAKDLALYKNHMFYANTKTLQRLNLDLLSVSQLVSGTSSITITNGTTSNTYTFVGEAEVTDFTFDTFANTTDGGYFLLNSASNERLYFVWMDKTGTTVQPSGIDTFGRLPIRIDLSTGIVTATQVATAVAAALDTIVDFDCPAPGGATITVTNTKNGNTDDAVNGLTGVGGVFAISVTNQGDGEDSLNLDVLLSSEATPSQQIDETARSLVKIINKNSADIVDARYLSGPDDVPGQILLEAKDLSTDEFYVLVNSDATGTQFNPKPATAKSGTVAIGTGTVTITSAAHGLSNGNQIVLYSSTSTPIIDGLYTISGVTVNTFNISTTVTVAGNVSFGVTSVSSDNEEQPNFIYFSKFQEPEAVPIVNNIPVGPQDAQILRILALRESLFILKEDGIYRLTGEVGNFIVDAFDTSVSIIAPDSAVILDNQIFALSDDGVIRISDTGVEVISRPIEDLLVKVTSSQYNFRNTTFGVSYSTDRAYLLWTVSRPSDTVATQCLRYNTFTNNWTIWPISKTCGVVGRGDDKLYLGASDQNFIEQERKNFNRTDYADREFFLSIGDDAIGDFSIQLSSIANADVGDSLLQTQYVTITQFNALLLKLDLEPNLQNNYFSSLEMVPGDDLSIKMSQLVTKLNADPAVVSTYTFSGATDFEDIQTEYNTIIDTLNLDDGLIFTNYRQSTGTVPVEVLVEEVLIGIGAPTNTVKVTFNLPFMKGPVSLFKFIKTDVIWAPYTFGDPSILKQVSEATMMFQSNVFTFGSVWYSSDLSPDFEEVQFEGTGNGDWGTWIWSELNWGGQGSGVPIRTYIPRDKQRCRYINQRFTGRSAREKFSIFGISLDFRPISSRAYRDI